MIVQPYRTRDIAYRGSRAALSGYGAYKAARYIMGSYAPTVSDYKGAAKAVYKVGSKVGSKLFAKKIYSANKKSRKVRRELYKLNKKDKPIAKLTKQVKNLQIMSKSDQGELIYRSRQESRCLASVNTQGVIELDGWQASTLEGVLANCKFFNPSVPGTLTTADLSSGTYQREIHFNKAYTRMRLRNNYQVPARVSVYCCVVKDDTNITARTAWGNGLTDISSLTYNSPMTYPTDSSQFLDMWKIQSHTKKLLSPGAECIISYNAPKFMYDPSLYDSHNLNYLKAYKCHIYMVVVEGVLGHDTSADERGNIQAGVDVELQRNFIVNYAAGAQIRLLVTSDSFDSFTNGGVITSKPVADNLGYSVS